MGKCKYCGKDAGFLRSIHKECEAKYLAGIKAITNKASSAAIGQSDLSALRENIISIARTSFIGRNSIKGLIIKGWENAVGKALEDNILTREEEDALTAYRKYFNFEPEDLDTHGVYTKLVMGAILRDIIEGKIPERLIISGNIPFNLQKTEKLIWLFQNVPYYESRSRTSYAGGYTGVSVKVAKGLYWRVGGFRGFPIVTTQNTLIDNGQVGITNKHLYFAGSRKSFRIKYEKMVSITPFSDGVGIQGDTASAKPQFFITGDGWFTYNLVYNIAKTDLV